MSDGDFEPVQQRASRLDISTSQALRELLALGALLENAEVRGWRVTPQVLQLLSGETAPSHGVVVNIAPDPEDPQGPTWMVTPEEQAAYEAGS
jgi:hypothetical protein